MIRYIRVFGAALGGVDRPRSRHDRRRACSMATTPARCSPSGSWRGSSSGFAILPYLTVVPAALADPPGRGALDRRVRRRGHRPAHRPADGPAARLPAVGPAGAVGSAAAAGRLDLPRSRDARPDGRQAGGPADRGRGDRALPDAERGRRRRPAGRAIRGSSSTRARSSTAGSPRSSSRASSTGRS